MSQDLPSYGSQTRGLTALLIVVASTAAALSMPQESSATPSLTGGGYIYHVSDSPTYALKRFNIAENVDETIDTSDPSCSGLNIDNIIDLEVDGPRRMLYWIAGYSRLARINLTTGVCQSIVSKTGKNDNNNWVTWRGLDIDETRHALFFVDNQGFAGGSQTDNQTLHYVNLDDIPETGSVPSSVHSVIPITEVSGQESDVNFAMDITINGDFGYIPAKNNPSDPARCPGSCPNGTAVYRVRLFGTPTPNVVTTTESEKVFVFTDPSTVDPQMITVEFHSGKMFFSNFDSNARGIRKADLSGYSVGHPVTTWTDVVTDDGPGFIDYGFAFAQNDILFTTDTEGGWGNWKLTWIDASPGAPVVDSGNFVDARSDTSWYGQIDFDDTAIPSTPAISMAIRLDANNVELTFSIPTDATASTSYPWYAVGSDLSILSGVCTSSPCTISGLVDGISYSFRIRQSWYNGANEIVHSLKSAAVTDSEPPPPSLPSFRIDVPTLAELATAKLPRVL